MGWAFLLMLLHMLAGLCTWQAFRRDISPKALLWGCTQFPAHSSNLNEDSCIVDSMRASAIKGVLKSTPETAALAKSLYDKDELKRLLLEHESSLQRRSDIITVPMRCDGKQVTVELRMGNSGAVRKFMLDTGASMNLCKAGALGGLSLAAQSVTTYGMGGTGTMAAKTTVLNEAYIADESQNEHSVRDVPFTVLDNESALPPEVAGLLSIKFLMSIGKVIEFDFERQRLLIDRSSRGGGGSSSMVSPVRRLRMEQVELGAGFDGLLTCEIFLNDCSGAVKGLVDIGSCYTIINADAVRLLGVNYDQLEVTPVRVAGIDNNSMSLRACPLQQLSLGQSGVLRVGEPFKVFVGDVPGLRSIGVQGPGAILGLDIFVRFRSVVLDVTARKMYLRR